MDKIRLADQVSKYMKRNGMNRTEVITALQDAGVKMEAGRLSRVVNGKGTEGDYKRICNGLSISDPDIDARLRVGCSQGFWAAPVLYFNHMIQGKVSDFFKHVQLTAYTEDGSPHFNKVGEPLERFESLQHNFYFSGEIADLLEQDDIDVGFMGSTIVDDKVFMRVARLVNASSSRHAMIVVAPKGVFKNEVEAIDHLLSPKEDKPKCHIYYQEGSTSKKEYSLLFQHANHDHGSIQILDLPKYRTSFQQKINAHRGEIVAQIALMLTIDTAEAIVHGKKGVKGKKDIKGMDPQKKNFDVFNFRTSEVVKRAREKKLDIKFLKEPELLEFYYEMVVRTDKRTTIVNQEGFKKLLFYLKKSVNRLADARKESGNPSEFERVADFFGLDRKKAIARLKDTEFDLLFYPEFVTTIMEMKIVRKDS